MANIKKINVGGTDYNIIDSRIPGIDTTPTSGSANVITSGGVYAAIEALPEPMIFKGSLGTGGTITTLPAASSANEGFTYKVITAGTYQSIAAKVGDTFISTGSAWVLIPSGDEPSGTVTSITLKATSPIAIDSTAAITTSGTRTLSHATSGVTAGTYKSVTVNSTGHVTAGTNPTTIAGYGITDAKIQNGIITLGSNSVTPVTVEGEDTSANHVAVFDDDGSTAIKDSGKSLSDYLARSGGQMTGPLTWADINALPQLTSPQYFLSGDTFAQGATTKWVSITDSKKALGILNSSGNEVYVKKAGDTMSGTLTIDSNTMGGVAHLAFTRNNGYSYIKAPSGGAVAICINNVGGAYTTFAADGESIFPGTTNGVKDIGKPNNRWRYAYANDLYVGSASNSQCHQQYDATNKCLKFIFD